MNEKFIALNEYKEFINILKEYKMNIEKLLIPEFN